MATTNQQAASALGVTLTGNQAMDDDAILHALSGASEAAKEAFFSIGAAPNDPRGYANATFAGHQEITKVLGADNKPVDVSSLDPAARDFYAQVNAGHEQTRSELENIFTNVLGVQRTATHEDAYGISSFDVSPTPDPGDGGGVHATPDPGNSGSGNSPSPKWSVPAPRPEITSPEIIPNPVSAVIAGDSTGGTSGASGGSSSSSGSSGSGGSATGSVGSSGDSSSPINRLIDLVAAQQGGGGGSSGGGIVALPTPLDSGTASSGSGIGKFILIALILGATYWFYRHHKAKSAK